MQCELFIAASRGQLRAGQVQRSSISLPDFDVERMRQGYYNEKKSLLRGFDRFAADWERKWSRLPHPQAGLIAWTRQELELDFIPTFAAEDEQLAQALRQQCRQAYAAVWTIGPALEQEAFDQVQSSALQAMFLDVAGSLLMAQIRSALHSFIDQLTQQQGQGELVLGEHIPEISEQDPRLLSIAAPWMETRQRPAFSLRPNGVLEPLKSQCSMVFVGQPQQGGGVRLNERPCSHCKGHKCLYLQFGGCHLPPQKQPKQTTANSGRSAAVSA